MHAVYHEFSERPLSDSCWSTSTGPDGRIYIACCVEHTGGGTATIVRPSPDGTPEYLFDMDEVTGDRRDSGRATQCKVHYSFVPDPEQNLLWCATHLSGPPIGEKRYNPWASWHDPVRAFRGASLVAWDVKRDRVAHSALIIPKEGCRCLAFNAQRRVMYVLTYPRDHLVRYDLARGELTDLGRLGSVNEQCLFLDRRGRVHTVADRGRVCVTIPSLGGSRSCRGPGRSSRVRRPGTRWSMTAAKIPPLARSTASRGSRARTSPASGPKMVNTAGSRISAQ